MSTSSERVETRAAAGGRLRTLPGSTAPTAPVRGVPAVS